MQLQMVSVRSRPVTHPLLHRVPALALPRQLVDTVPLEIAPSPLARVTVAPPLPAPLSANSLMTAGGHRGRKPLPTLGAAMPGHPPRASAPSPQPAASARPLDHDPAALGPEITRRRGSRSRPRVDHDEAAAEAPLVDLEEADLATPGTVFQIGVAPVRIDILTKIDAVEFDEAWREKVATKVGGVRVHVLSRAHLIQNKRAAGRLQDLADAERLERGDED